MQFTSPASGPVTLAPGSSVAIVGTPTIAIDQSNPGVTNITQLSQGNTNAVTTSLLPIGTLGDGSDGAVVLAGTVTLTRDMQYLTLAGTGTLKNASFVVRCQGLVSGSFAWNNAGTTTTPAPTGSMTGGGLGGGASALSAPSGASQSVNGQTAPAMGNADVQGGTGGSGGTVVAGNLVVQGGDPGQAGAATPVLITSTIGGIRVSGGGGGGGGGCALSSGSGSATAGAGGGGGGPIVVFCDTFSNTGTFTTTGGNGGNSAITLGTSLSAGAGGGGGGGGGPVIIVAATAVTVTPTISNAGGTAGLDHSSGGGSGVVSASTAGSSGTSKAGTPSVRVR